MKMNSYSFSQRCFHAWPGTQAYKHILIIHVYLLYTVMML